MGRLKFILENYRKLLDYINNDFRDVKKKINQFNVNKELEKKENVNVGGGSNSSGSRNDRKQKNIVVQIDGYLVVIRRRKIKFVQYQYSFDQEYVGKVIQIIQIVFGYFF